ncbi:MAG: serine/threonine-protein kinase [Planctomycetota bacterium]|nr:serine/threonine-protein kinase [Planctomycetota bacterium]
MSDVGIETSEDREQRLADVLSNAADAVCRGDLTDLHSMYQEHPDLETDLRRLFGTMLVTDTAGASLDEGITSTESQGRWRSLQLPVVIGDYRLEDEIGRGGMGVVFRAKQISLNRTVAVKMILRGRLASDTDIGRFLSEAKATAKLEHPNIVPVYEAGDMEGRAFFSMKLIEGPTLSERVAAQPLRQRDAASLVAKIARAIGYAHQQGILHRDLKPSNIIIASEDIPMVTDFGLAKQVDSQMDATRSGALVGTPAYMSPEQASGRTHLLGPGSDIYSLGCVLYYALTGRSPFLADTPMDLVMQVIEQEPVSPRALRPRLDRDLEMITIRCLQKPIDLRYETAEALAEDLEAYLADEKVVASSGRFTQVIARMFRETHHAGVLENWGTLWIWHSMMLLVAGLLTWQLNQLGYSERWVYGAVWTVGLGAWAGVFWKIRQRIGPVTFVERQVAHVWGASMVAIAMLFPIEAILKLPVLTFSPLLGIISSMVFVIKASMFHGIFYLQAAVLSLTAVAMAIWPNHGHLLFGLTSAGCFFIPGYKYSRVRRRKTVLEST